MAKKYRVLERPRFEKESVYIAQAYCKFLGLFPYWHTYQQYTIGGESDREFETAEQAKAYIANDAKFDLWYATSGDRVITVYQINTEGELEEVV